MEKKKSNRRKKHPDRKFYSSIVVTLSLPQMKISGNENLFPSFPKGSEAATGGVL